MTAGQDTDDLVSLIDVTRTIFDAAQVTPQQADQLQGRSLLSWYSPTADKSTTRRDAVFSGRERHSSSRFNSLGYPCRCIRTKTHLYIRNFTPERWPAGAPQKYDKAGFDPSGVLTRSTLGAADAGYHDIDDGPTLRWMIDHRDQPDVARLLAAAVKHRPGEELYDIVADPACLNDLAQDPSSREIKHELASQLTEYLTRTADLRQTDPVAADVWETYPRISGLRWFPVPEWASENPDRIPRQDWLDKRRPR